MWLDLGKFADVVVALQEYHLAIAAQTQLSGSMSLFLAVALSRMRGCCVAAA
jgi:hypothetical protein